MDESTIIEHISNAIDISLIHDKPSDYIFIENVFPTEYYNQILNNLQNVTPFYKKQVHVGSKTDFFGSYDTREQIYVPDELQNCDQLDFFIKLKSILSSEAVFKSFRDKFDGGFNVRFPGEDITTIKNALNPTLLLTKHKEGYYLGPHTDRKEKVMTCILYFPETDNLEHLGTAMYKPKQEGFTCKGVVHHNPDKFIFTHKVPCKKNSALIFFRDDKLFHGVESMSTEDAKISERYNIQFNYWLPWGSNK